MQRKRVVSANESPSGKRVPIYIAKTVRNLVCEKDGVWMNRQDASEVELQPLVTIRLIGQRGQ